MQRIAFNGVGTMGSGMAARLLAAGFPVTIYNRNLAKADRLREHGARVAATPAEAAADADVVISMVADDPASRAIWTGDHGALSRVKSGAVLVESSTITPEWARELASLADARGLRLLDAPVTGSRAQAANGQLLFLVGGDAAALEEARPALQAMARGIVHLGPSGAGALMKLINNFLCGVQAASMAEAFAWIARSGLDAGAALPILLEGAPGSPLVRTVADRMARRDYDPHFRVELMEKDLRYALEEARGAGLDLATATAALTRFREAIAKGGGDHDISAVWESVRVPVS